MRLVFAAVLALPILACPARQVASQQAAAQPSGAHGVRNERFGLFLRPRDASNRDGEPIVVYPFQPWKCMAWRFEAAPDGTRLVNFFTGKSFEIQSGGGHALLQAPASAEQAHAERFRFVALGGDRYEIVGANGDALTAVESDGGGDLRVVVQPWKNDPAQRWQLVDLPDHFTM